MFFFSKFNTKRITDNLSFYKFKQIKQNKTKLEITVVEKHNKQFSGCECNQK